MCVKLLIVLVVLLQHFSPMIAAERYTDMYPDASSCFEGKNPEAHEWVASIHSEAKENCTNRENPEQTSLCYKVCLLIQTGIIRNNYAPYGSSSAECVGLYAWDEPETIQKKLEQARERLYECEKLEISVPKPEEKNCQDWDPEHLESIQKMVTCIEDAVILQQFGTFTTGEKYSVVYPDVSSCFEGTIREPPEWLTSMHSKAKENCTNLENPEENSLCFKVCTLLKADVINHNYVLYGSTSAECLGLYEWEESESIQNKLEQARERLKECEKLEISVPKMDEKNCKDWEPEHQESMQKMVTCVEDAVKC